MDLSPAIAVFMIRCFLGPMNLHADIRQKTAAPLSVNQLIPPSVVKEWV